MNRADIIGRLGRDPETRRLQNGGSVVNFSLATSETWTDKASGERKERTQWHNVVIFNEQIAGIAEKYLRKGSRARICGAIETREYDDRDGVKRRATEIVLRAFRGELELLGDPPAHAGEDSYGTTRTRDQRPADAPREPARQSSGAPPIDDDIPF